ncbi:uncharacterized protein LOC121902455 [Thunnus maccoyii]|uniref:uncharacterized protein LOC121902455 n=1 Tax=Thunnus maccoyii TaxID=8240 RepID=UPI001C4C2C07|nr:uncharacterized protein LOC121902455 [Thunnus maccoyii]XP_042275712.1 uncharacterized protein LOC121902455 [Thunnus maccoyii]
MFPSLPPLPFLFPTFSSTSQLLPYVHLSFAKAVFPFLSPTLLPYLVQILRFFTATSFPFLQFYLISFILASSNFLFSSLARHSLLSLHLKFSIPTSFLISFVPTATIPSLPSLPPFYPWSFPTCFPMSSPFLFYFPDSPFPSQLRCFFINCSFPSSYHFRPPLFFFSFISSSFPSLPLFLQSPSFHEYLLSFFIFLFPCLTPRTSVQSSPWSFFLTFLNSSYLLPGSDNRYRDGKGNRWEDGQKKGNPSPFFLPHSSSSSSSAEVGDPGELVRPRCQSVGRRGRRDTLVFQRHRAVRRPLSAGTLRRSPRVTSEGPEKWAPV